VLDIGIVL